MASLGYLPYSDSGLAKMNWFERGNNGDVIFLKENEWPWGVVITDSGDVRMRYSIGYQKEAAELNCVPHFLGKTQLTMCPNTPESVKTSESENLCYQKILDTRIRSVLGLDSEQTMIGERIATGRRNVVANTLRDVAKSDVTAVLHYTVRGGNRPSFAVNCPDLSKFLGRE